MSNTPNTSSIASKLKQAQNNSITGPGHHLREARERGQISIEQVASQLKLSVRMVRALEADDYSHINSLIFLKGYLRHYAHAVGLEAEAVVAQINPRQFEEECERQPRIEYKVKLFTRDQFVRWMTLGFGVLMVGLVLAWWHSHSQMTPLTLLPDTDVAPIVSDPAELNSAGPNADISTPLYDDHDLVGADTSVQDPAPAEPNSPEQPDPVESFTYYQGYHDFSG